MIACKRTMGQQTGLTFNELLVAMNIAVVAVLGYSLSSVDALRRQTAAANSTVAIHLAQDKVESLLAVQNPSDADLCPSGGEHGISATGLSPGRFDRCWKVSPSAFGANLKQIDVSVSWRDHEPHQVTFSTLVYFSE